MIAALRAALPELESAGVTLCLENSEGCPVAVLADIITTVVELWTPWQGSIDATVRTEREWTERSVAALRKVIRE